MQWEFQKEDKNKPQKKTDWLLSFSVFLFSPGDGFEPP